MRTPLAHVKMFPAPRGPGSCTKPDPDLWTFAELQLLEQLVARTDRIRRALARGAAA